MASRRMFSIAIISSDLFLDMSPSAKWLYMACIAGADDEGFIDNINKIVRTAIASNDDVSLLLEKKFIIKVAENIHVIPHWYIHNTIQMDRFKKSRYADLREIAHKNSNGIYVPRKSKKE